MQWPPPFVTMIFLARSIGLPDIMSCNNRSGGCIAQKRAWNLSETYPLDLSCCTIRESVEHSWLLSVPNSLLTSVVALVSMPPPKRSSRAMQPIEIFFPTPFLSCIAAMQKQTRSRSFATCPARALLAFPCSVLLLRVFLQLLRFQCF
jgi:hypothetical protein